MQIVNPMGNDEFDNVCETGVKLVEQLKKLLISNGLSQNQAANVLAMAVGGVIKSLEIDPEEFMQAASIAFQMWRQENGTTGINGVIFDPPHKRPDFVPASRDSSLEN